MVARLLLSSVTLAALSVFASACGGNETSGNGGNALSGAEQAKAAGDGVGSTLGGCPDQEQADGATCDVPGRMCNWKRSCGARATGWCTSAGKWRVVAGPCSPCPETATTHQVSQGGAPSDGTPEPEEVPVCSAGLTCAYPSTPLGGGVECSCESDGQWNSLCASKDDGWKPASTSGGGDSACVELAACAGRSGCGTTCSGTVSPGPNGTANVPAGQTTKSCGCGEDGLMYCAIKPCGG